MQVKRVALNQATGHILLHNHVGRDGRRLISKGRHLTEEDVAKLAAAGRDEIYVAVLDPADVDENEAARRLGAVISAGLVRITKASTGRVNLIAEQLGLCKVKADALLTLNEIDGLTLATIRDNTVVEPNNVLATLKIIPYAVPEAALQQAETVAQTHFPLVEVKPFTLKRAVLIMTGSQNSADKIRNSFVPALQERLHFYYTDLVVGPYVAEEEAEIREALQWALAEQAEMILVAGETSVMDRDDITPRAIKAIGGELVHHGVPVEPGNLLMVAYYGDIPIVGAPGCARSKNYNVVDMVLPRLIAGERLTRRDLAELGYGGYLK